MTGKVTVLDAMLTRSSASCRTGVPVSCWIVFHDGGSWSVRNKLAADAADADAADTAGEAASGMDVKDVKEVRVARDGTSAVCGIQ